MRACGERLALLDYRFGCIRVDVSNDDGGSPVASKRACTSFPNPSSWKALDSACVLTSDPNVPSRGIHIPPPTMRALPLISIIVVWLSRSVTRIPILMGYRSFIFIHYLPNHCCPY